MSRVGLATDDFGTRRHRFRQRDQPVSLEREDQIGQHMSGQRGGQGTRRVAGLSIGHQGAAPSHHAAHEVAPRIRLRHQTALSNRQDRRLARLELFSLAERMRDYQAMPGIRQSLSEPLE